MPTLQEKATLLLSLAFRTAAYLFLRWIPGGLFPPAIYSLFALYLPLFITSYLTQKPYDIVTDEIDITITETELKNQTSPTYASVASHPYNLRKQEKPPEVIQDIQVDETVALALRKSKFWRTILTGLPSPTSSLLSLLTLLINISLLAAVTDFTYRARIYYPSQDLSFARIGYVGVDNAKLVIREPDQSKLPITVTLHLHEPKAPFDPTIEFYRGGVNYLTAENDYTIVIPMEWKIHLNERRYVWRTSNNHTGTFTTPPKPGKSAERNGGQYTFLTTSCILPRFPYNPFDHPLSIKGFQHLAKNIPSLGAQFMLFLGDFIYVDVPRRFGTDVENYRRHYRQVYASPDWPSVSQNLPWIHVLDDHEIANDWSSNTTGVYEAAVNPFHIYQTEANPPLAAKDGVSSKRASYFHFVEGPAAFFMMDTRSHRSPVNIPVNSAEKTMLGSEQLDNLLEFLRRPVPKGVKWKIIASSVPFTKNWRVNGVDTWGGYLVERRVILEAMWDVGAAGNGIGVIVLSGDRHEFAATAFPPPVDGKWPISATVHEFSTSPLNQFYIPIKSYHQTDDEDIMIKYIATGNSKFAAISIENPESTDQSLLKYKLFIDGEEAWQHVLLSPSMPDVPKTTGEKLKGVFKVFGDSP